MKNSVPKALLFLLETSIVRSGMIDRDDKLQAKLDKIKNRAEADPESDEPKPLSDAEIQKFYNLASNASTELMQQFYLYRALGYTTQEARNMSYKYGSQDRKHNIGGNPNPRDEYSDEVASSDLRYHAKISSPEYKTRMKFLVRDIIKAVTRKFNSNPNALKVLTYFLLVGKPYQVGGGNKLGRDKSFGEIGSEWDGFDEYIDPSEIPYYEEVDSVIRKWDITSQAHKFGWKGGPFWKIIMTKPPEGLGVLRVTATKVMEFILDYLENEYGMEFRESFVSQADQYFYESISTAISLVMKDETC